MEAELDDEENALWSPAIHSFVSSAGNVGGSGDVVAVDMSANDPEEEDSSEEEDEAGGWANFKHETRCLG